MIGLNMMAVDPFTLIVVLQLGWNGKMLHFGTKIMMSYKPLIHHFLLYCDVTFKESINFPLLSLGQFIFIKTVNYYYSIIVFSWGNYFLYLTR